MVKAFWRCAADEEEEVDEEEVDSEYERAERLERERKKRKQELRLLRKERKAARRAEREQVLASKVRWHTPEACLVLLSQHPPLALVWRGHLPALHAWKFQTSCIA